MENLSNRFVLSTRFFITSFRNGSLASKNDVQDNRYKSQIFAFVKSKAKFMYSYNDFERLFLRYKLEGIPAGVSIEKFCMSNKVPLTYFSNGTRIPGRRQSLFRFWVLPHRNQKCRKVLRQFRNKSQNRILGFLVILNFESWWISA